LLPISQSSFIRAQGRFLPFENFEPNAGRPQ
jgi:hypothetical protein